MAASSLMSSPHFKRTAASGPGRRIVPRRLISFMNGLMGSGRHSRRLSSVTSNSSAVACRARS
eukprot:8155886-Pyramimonas_sp.AAC.1